MSRAVRIALPIALIVLGAAFLCIGAAAGQATAVLHKAIRICLECIGIG